MFAKIVNRLRAEEKGFTLIELLVVVAIIALLATFAVPRLFDAINKAKEAPGQADLQTISAALDRYYFDENRYPATLDVLTTDGYLKAQTTFMNGFKHSYLYGVPTGGDAYVLIDPKDVETAQATVCSTALSPSWDPTDAHRSVVMTKANIDSCTAPTGMTAAKY